MLRITSVLGTAASIGLVIRQEDGLFYTAPRWPRQNQDLYHHAPRVLASPIANHIAGQGAQ